MATPPTRARLLCVAVVVLFQILSSASANQIVLEGADGVVQFGDSPSDPSFRRSPDPEGGATDRLVLEGASALDVDGSISATSLTASLLDLNSTGGTVLANELIVNSLTVNGASSGGQAAAGHCNGLNAPTLAVQSHSAGMYSAYLSVPASATGMQAYYGWNVDTARSYQHAGVFTLSNAQTITIEQDGYYEMTLEHMFTANGVADEDQRFVAVQLGVGGALVTETGSYHCFNHGTRRIGDPHAASCKVRLQQGTVLGVYLFVTVSDSYMFVPRGRAVPLWTITQIGTA